MNFLTILLTSFYLKRSSIIFFVIVLLVININSAIGQQPDLKFKIISTSQGLSQSNVTAILEDSKGFMWFATRGGLNKYDGYKITTYLNDQKNEFSISSNSIRDIAEDKEGNIWIATLDEGLNCFDPKLNKFIRYQHDPKNAHSISSNSLDNLFVDSEGVLWIGTLLSGLNRFDRKNNRFVHYRHNQNDPRSLSDDAIYDILEDSKGNMWIGTEKGGLNLFDRKKNTFTHFRHNPNDSNSISQDFVRDIYEDSKGNLWLATYGEGLNLFDRENQRFIHYRYNPYKNSLSYDVLLCISEDVAGNLWIGTENGGLSILDKDRTTFSGFVQDENNPNSLNNNSIYCIYRDSKGHMWVGTYSGGINFYDRFAKKFKTYSHTENSSKGLNNKSVLAFAEDKEGKIWIGTDGGGLNVFNRNTGEFSYYTYSNNDKNTISGNFVVSVVVDKNDNIWAATWMDGVNFLDRKKNIFTRYKHSENDQHSLSYDGTWHMLEDRKGNIWVTTIGGGLNLFNNKYHNFRRFVNNPEDSNSLCHNNIHYVFEDSRENLWIGTDVAGLIKFNRQKGTFDHYKHKLSDPNSLSNNIINSINEDKNGNLWICTNAGLNQYDYSHDNFKIYLEKVAVKGALEDAHGNLWLGSNNGLHRFNPKQNKLKSYYLTDGLQANEFNYKAFLKTRNGEMLFGGPNGFNIFHPDSIQDNPSVPPVVLTNFNIFNKPVLVGVKNSPLKEHISRADKIILSHAQTVFSIEFAALNFSQPESNQYAYKLEGFDKAWNYVGNVRTATYTNLDPGEYVFKVKASNNDGVWNERGTSIRIVITPPFWETFWFRTLIVALVFGSGNGWYILRMRAADKQRKELERQVKERTTEILGKNEELEAQAKSLKDANQEIKELYVEIKDSIRAAQVIQQSILPADCLIKRHLPDSFVYYRPKDVVSGDFYWFDVIDDKVLLAAVDCTGHGVSGAFMAINGHHLLHQSIVEQQLIASDILNNLNKGLSRVLHQGEDEISIRDGMDIALCIIDQKKQTLQFSGACNPLYLIREEKLIEIKGNKFPIGMMVKGRTLMFTNHEIQLEQGDTFYIFSDGYADQMGGTNGDEKYLYVRFRQLLLSIHKEPFHKQKEILEHTLDSWKKDREQLDDIMVIGFKIS